MHPSAELKREQQGDVHIEDCDLLAARELSRLVIPVAVPCDGWDNISLESILGLEHALTHASCTWMFCCVDKSSIARSRANHRSGANSSCVKATL